MQSAAFRMLRSLWARLPSEWRQKFWLLAGEQWQEAYARQMIARPASFRPISADAPLVVAGLFRTASGIGEGARSTYRALQAAGLSPIAVDLSEPFAPTDLISDIKCQPMPSTLEGTLILQLNGPETMSAMQHLGMVHGKNWFTIGYWAWELPVFPPTWEKSFRYLSEIWTVSQFSAEAIIRGPSPPGIRVFGHSIAPPSGVRAARKKLGWAHDEFVFLTMADSMSSLHRKNPFDTILAFKAAFKGDRKKRLIVKTRNLDTNPAAKADLQSAIGDDETIELVDEALSDHERWTLLKSVDSVISLHRSEGFGLVIAEAMALGKPVICTGWSGNMDFTTTETAALVDYKLVGCEDSYGIYAGHQTTWAQPNFEDAVSKITRVAEDQHYRTRISSAAKNFISVHANPAVIGRKMRESLSHSVPEILPASNITTEN